MTNKKKAHCNVCRGDRNHEVLHTVSTHTDYGDYASGSDTYETLKCCGCEAIKLRSISWFSEDDEPIIRYFPPAVSRAHPIWFDDLILELPLEQAFVADLLNEVYVALHNDLTSLATMGVRALLEKIMISLSGDLGSFSRHVKKFEELGYISKKQRERLEAILDAGHAAMHRAYSPHKNDVVTLLDITENIIESVYLHDGKIERLKKNVPTKAKRTNSDIQ